MIEAAAAADEVRLDDLAAYRPREFLIEGLAAGSYKIEVSVPGYPVRTGRIVLAEGVEKTLEYDAEMPPKAFSLSH